MGDNGIKPVVKDHYTTYSNLDHQDAFKVGSASHHPKQEFKDLLAKAREMKDGPPSLRDEMIDPQEQVQYIDHKRPSLQQAKEAGLDMTTEHEALSDWGVKAIWNSDTLEIATATHAELQGDLEKACADAEANLAEGRLSSEAYWRFKDDVDLIQADLDYALAARKQHEGSNPG
jgi:hypothetical protein